jgi:hypothetical protein
MPRFIRSACLTNYVPIARSFGLDPHPLLREAGLDRSCLTDPEIKIPVGEVFRTPTGFSMVYSTRSLGRETRRVQGPPVRRRRCPDDLAFGIDQ